MNFIQGEKFIDLADNELIFYCHTHEANDFLKSRAPNTPFILITHNSDGAVEFEATRNDSASFNLAPEHLIKWFAQNVKHKSHKLVSIPIGLENSQWFPEIKKREKILNIKQTNKSIKNLIYLNLNTETNPVERNHIYDICSKLNYVSKQRGHNSPGLFDDYLNNVYNHPFVVSAAGNGEDCHRTWETMYVGSIPIVKKSINSSFYSHLPICFVDFWEQLTDESFLIKEYERIKNTEYNANTLNFNYWKELILKEKANLFNLNR